MRHPLKDFSHHLKLLLAELRHTAERTIAPDQGFTGSVQQFSQLEQRLMMSASPAAVVAAADAAEVSSTGASVDEILDQVFQADTPVDAESRQSASDTDSSDSNQNGAMSQVSRELVIIDAAILNPDEWIAGLRHDIDTDFDVLILSKDADGFSQIADALDGSILYSAVHVVSHGADAQISLGQSILDLHSLQQNESVLGSWRAGLSDGADVLIYGCELAESEDGRQLVDSLAQLWEADVAASDDLTGHHSLIGDWELEYQSGVIQAPVAFSDAYTERWVGVLSVNAAPVNVVPDGQTVLQDRILSLNSANGNAISVSDSDVGVNDLQVTVTADAGTFALTDIGTAEYVTGDGYQDSTIVLQGTTTELNAALQTLHYTADGGFVGAVNITVFTDDLGNGGAVSSAQDTDVISVFVHDEFTLGGYTVANSATDELNRNANRGVARSLAAGPNGDLISVWRTATDDVFYAIHDNMNILLATGQINDAGVVATDVAVASGNDGSFVVAWSQEGGADTDIFAQQYSATGVIVGSRITVDSSVGTQQAVTIDRNAAGDFVIAWENTSDGVHLRRFAADGTAIDASVVSPPTGSGGQNASVGIDRDLNVLLGWNDGSGQYLQRFDGTAWGTRRTLSTDTNAGGSSIGMTENGRAVIAWHYEQGNWQSRYQLVASDGTLIGSPRVTPSTAGGDELNPSVALDEAGNFVIAWETNAHVQARRFAADGTALGGDITIAATGDFENNAAVAVLDVNNFAVMFTRQSSNSDVVVSRFNAAAVDTSNPVFSTASRTVGAANSTFIHQFLAGDDVSDPSALNIGFASSNPSLIGSSDISVVGTGLYGELSITPTPNLIGSADITVTVLDIDGNSTQENFTVFVASPFINVTTTADELDGSVSSIIDLLANPGGTGISLREAITAANNTANSGRRDRIGFDIAGGGQHTLTLNSELPAITEAVFVDGTTQPGYSSSPLIGLDGSLVIGNGLTIQADDVVVRGLAIFDFQQSGVDLDTGNGILLRDADNATIDANYLGLDQSGSAVGNDRNGIRIIGQSNDNVIGGETANRKNVISGNRANGISIAGDAGSPAAGNQIQSNFIGVGSDGVTDIGNSFVGVDVRNAAGTQIVENVISGNSDSGIELSGGLVTDTVIQGNYIGVASDGVTAVGNDADGIALYTSAGDGPSNTKIGGVPSGEANIIANNSLIGVRLDSGGGIGNSIRGNQIFNNPGALGIDLLGVNGNDNDDVDSGTNGQQNYPEIASAVLGGSDLVVQGSLNSNPNTVFDIDVYASVTPDPDGFGEAEIFVGTFNVTTDSFGDASFNETLNGVGLSTGMFLTATATNSDGSTSEFSQNELITDSVTPNSPPTVSLANVVADIDENSDTSGGIAVADILVADDGEGTNDLSLAGTNASDFEIVGTQLRLRSGVTLDYETATSLTVEVRVDDAALPGSPEDSASITIAINDLADTVAQEAFWFSTVSDVTSAVGGTGVSSWQTEDVVVLGDPNLSLGAGTTEGHLSVAFNIQSFVQDGQTSISGLHVVGRDITVGTSTSVDLQAGDILLSTATSETFNGGSLTTTQHDIVLFRPDSQFDYSSGTFSILIDGIGGSGLSNLAAFTLIEQTTIIGDTSVNAGDFLFVTTATFGSNDIVLYEVGDVGEGTTTGTATQLLDGTDLGLTGAFSLPGTITTLELIENETTIGGITLDSGTILFSSTASPNGLSTENNDVIALDVTATEIGSGTTTAAASMVVRGDDIGLTFLSSLSLGNQPSQVTSLTAVADNTLSDDTVDTNYGSSNSLVVDKGGSGLGDERSIIRFDLSSLPAGAVITSAYLRLEATTVSNSFNIEAYELIESWDENTSTYDDRTSGTGWGTGGGTVDSTVLDTVDVDSPGAYQWDITSLAASWQNGSRPNNGVLLGSSETGNENAIFGSRESDTPPQLIIEYALSTNIAPVANIGGPYSINEGDSLNLDASGSADSNGDTLTYSWDLDNDGSFDDAVGVSPSLAWSALPTSVQDDGTYTVRVSVSDGNNPAEVATTTLTVANVGPTGNSDGGAGFTTAADSAFTTSSAVSNDTDPAGSNDPIQITSIDTTGTLGDVSIASGDQAFEYDPNGQFDHLSAGETATDTFLYSISDGDGGTATDVLVTVTIQGVNDAPTGIQLDSLTVAEELDSAVVGQLSTTDVDASDTHSYSVSDGRFTVVGDSLRLRTGQSVDFETEPTISIDVTTEDQSGVQIVRTFALSVVDANDVAPVIAAGQVFGVSEQASSGSTVGTVAASDVDTVGSLQGFTIDSGNTGGVFLINAATGVISVADASLLDGLNTPFYDLQVRVSDGLNTSTSVVVRVNVADTNAAPTAADDLFTLNEGQAFSSNVQSDWFNASWKNRQQITIDNSGIASDLTDYTLRLRFHASDPNAINIDYSNLNADGSDLVFVDPDSTILAYEIERWDPSGFSDVWVRVPVIDGGTTDSIAVYYNSDAANPTAAAETTWWSTDAVVLHLDGDAVNSSGRAADGVATNVTAVPGVTGQAFAFDGSDSEIRFAAEPAVNDLFVGGATISAWINPSDWGENGSGRIVDKAATWFGANDAGWSFQLDDSSGAGRLVFETGFSGDFGRWSTVDGSVDLNQWQHVAVVYDSSDAANDPRLFINGVEQTVVEQQTPVGTVLSDAANDLIVGNYNLQPSRTFDGLIDEVRFRASVVSDSEIQAEYRDIVNPVVSVTPVTEGPGGVLGNDFDSDADSLNVMLVSGPAHASAFQLNADGSFTYTHDGSETTADSFIYEISDGVTTDTATVSLNIIPQNDQTPDITTGQTFTLSEAASGGTVVGTVAGTDGDAATTLSDWTIVSGNADGDFQIDSTTGQITVATGANLDFEGQSVFNLGVTVSDGVNTSAVETVQVQLTDENDSIPVLTPGLQFGVSEAAASGTVVGSVTANDSDGVGSLTDWMIISGNADGYFQIDSTTGQITVATGANLDFEGQNVFNLGVTVSDGVNTSAVETVQVNLNDVNDNAPVITSGQTFTVSETIAPNTVLGAIIGTDADVGNSLSQWAIVSGNDAGNFVLDSNTGQLRIASSHSLDFAVANTFTLGVTTFDGVNTSAIETLVIQVTDVDSPPSISAISDQTILEDAAATTVSFTVQDSDTASADLIVTAISSNDSLIQTSSLILSGTGTNRQLSFVPTTNQSGGFSTLTITVSDGTTSFNQSFDVNVVAVNDAPVIAPIASQTVNEDQSLAVNFSVSDVDSPLGVLSVSASSSDLSLVSASGLQFTGSAAAPVLNVTPESDQFGSVQITVMVSDGLTSSGRSFLLDVNNVNDAPTLSNSSIDLTVPDRSLAISSGVLLTGAADIDSSVLQPLLVAAPVNGSLFEFSPGEFVYTPDAGFSGADQFTYVVTDGVLQSGFRVVQLNVLSVVESLEATNPPPSRAVTPASSSTAQESLESNSELSPTTESDAETDPSQVGDSKAMAVAARTVEDSQTDQKAESGQGEDSAQPILGKVESQLDSGFVFLKVVQIDEVGSGSVGGVDLRDDNNRLTQQNGRRGQSTDQLLGSGNFDQSDWQYYSDLKSTVGGVQVFRENLENEFAFSDFTTGTITLASTGAAVGFVVTAVRSGMLALGFLSQLPVWTLFDPLMVVDGVTGEDSEEDSIHDIVDRQSAAVDAQESGKATS